jgi:hypothetical protein
MRGYGTYKVLTPLFNEETSESYPLYIHKIEVLPPEFVFILIKVKVNLFLCQSRTP